MARDGSGTYNRTQSDYVFDTIIDETKINSELNDMATALTGSLAKDGQTNPSANLPMNNFKHTGVADATARTDYAAAGQITDGELAYAGVAGGTADALTVTLSPAVTALVTGMRFLFKAGASNNTGAATIAINGLSAVALQINDAALSADAIVANKWYEGLYDGAAVQITRLAITPASGDLLAANNLSDLANAATARTNLGLVIGTDVQADLDVPSQAEAEAGTATTERVWTAERVKQAIEALASSKVVQEVYASDATYANDSANNIPKDNTIPQNTEGAEAVTVSITPTSSSNILVIQAGGLFTNSVSTTHIALTLFQDSTADALAAVGFASASGSNPGGGEITHRMTAGTTSATTFKLRYGASSGTTYRNGDSASRLYGGVANSWIRVTEMAA